MSLLEVTGLTRSVRSVIAVDQLDLAIAPDETVSVIGPNGVGKTTLFKFARAPYFAAMFAAAGYPVQDDGTVSDQLIDTLVVIGDASAVTARLTELLASGLDELLLTQVPLGDAAVERTRWMHVVGRI